MQNIKILLNVWIVSDKKRSVYLGGTAQMIIINLFNRLKVNEPFQLGLMLVWEEKQKKNI